MGRSSKGEIDDSFGTRINKFSRRTKLKLQSETAASHEKEREKERERERERENSWGERVL